MTMLAAADLNRSVANEKWYLVHSLPRAERTAEFEPAFKDALHSGRPTLLHLKLDPDIITTRTTLTAIRECPSDENARPERPPKRSSVLFNTRPPR